MGDTAQRHRLGITPGGNGGPPCSGPGPTHPGEASNPDPGHGRRGSQQPPPQPDPPQRPRTTAIQIRTSVLLLSDVAPLRRCVRPPHQNSLHLTQRRNARNVPDTRRKPSSRVHRSDIWRESPGLQPGDASSSTNWRMFIRDLSAFTPFSDVAPLRRCVRPPHQISLLLTQRRNARNDPRRQWGHILSFNI